MELSESELATFKDAYTKLENPSLAIRLSSVVGLPVEAITKQLSSDHDPLFEFHRWKVNLRILKVTEVKTVPYVPTALAAFRGTARSDHTAGVSLSRTFLERP
jgi:hypothetical protein